MCVKTQNRNDPTYRAIDTEGVVLLFVYTLNSLSTSILCSGRSVRIMIVSSEICGLRTVNLALCRTRVKAIFFSRTFDSLGLSIDDIYTLSSPSVRLK